MQPSQDRRSSRSGLDLPSLNTPLANTIQFCCYRYIRGVELLEWNIPDIDTGYQTGIDICVDSEIGKVRSVVGTPVLGLVTIEPDAQVHAAGG
jgi:hypothetical protein